MKLLIAVLALVALAGCSGKQAEAWLSNDTINTWAVQRVESKVDSLRLEIAALRAELKEARP